MVPVRISEDDGARLTLVVEELQATFDDPKQRKKVSRSFVVMRLMHTEFTLEEVFMRCEDEPFVHHFLGF